MTDKLNEALQNVEMSYKELVDIANSILNPIISPVDNIVAIINANINSLSIDSIRNYILELQLKAFEISEIKEKSATKAELAEVIQKAQFATAFNGSDGSAAVKDKLALIKTSEEAITTVLYELIANLLKTKVDQLHRLVDCLKSILMSRMQETKFMNIGTTNEIGSTINTTKTILNE